jgi:hypothetical protein
VIAENLIRVTWPGILASSYQVRGLQAAANEIGRDARAMKKVGEALRRCAAGIAIQNRRFPDVSTKFPVRSKTFPVSGQEFPVPLRREFSCKPLNSLADWARKSRRRAGIRKIPC